MLTRLSGLPQSWQGSLAVDRAVGRFVTLAPQADPGYRRPGREHARPFKPSPKTSIFPPSFLKGASPRRTEPHTTSRSVFFKYTQASSFAHHLHIQIKIGLDGHLPPPCSNTSATGPRPYPRNASRSRSFLREQDPAANASSDHGEWWPIPEQKIGRIQREWRIRLREWERRDCCACRTTRAHSQWRTT